ncbi:hypothetical protein DFAR_1660005 [Desulfarculales bacterium]
MLPLGQIFKRKEQQKADNGSGESWKALASEQDRVARLVEELPTGAGPYSSAFPGIPGIFHSVLARTEFAGSERFALYPPLRRPGRRLLPHSDRASGPPQSQIFRGVPRPGQRANGAGADQRCLAANTRRRLGPGRRQARTRKAEKALYYCW